MEQLTQAQIEEWEKRIDAMSQEDMARLWRFAEIGHPVFQRDLPLFDYFMARFKGMTPELSKTIGLRRTP